MNSDIRLNRIETTRHDGLKELLGDHPEWVPLYIVAFDSNTRQVIALVSQDVPKEGLEEIREVNRQTLDEAIIRATEVHH